MNCVTPHHPRASRPAAPAMRDIGGARAAALSSRRLRLMVRTRWLGEHEAADRYAIGRAIAELIKDAMGR